MEKGALIREGREVNIEKGERFKKKVRIAEKGMGSHMIILKTPVRS